MLFLTAIVSYLWVPLLQYYLPNQSWTIRGSLLGYKVCCGILWSLMAMGKRWDHELLVTRDNWFARRQLSKLTIHSVYCSSDDCRPFHYLKRMSRRKPWRRRRDWRPIACRWIIVCRWSGESPAQWRRFFHVKLNYSCRLVSFASRTLSSIAAASLMSVYVTSFAAVRRCLPS